MKYHLSHASVMGLVWLSARELGSDLAATTEISICQSMARAGTEVTLISPGSFNSPDFHHIGVKKINFPGLHTLSGARNVRKIIAGNNGIINDCDVLFVDWRYVKPLKEVLICLKIPWLIIDRGPPTYLGLLNRLQKQYWRSGWEIANEYASGGLVVSIAHGQFVTNRVDTDLDIHVVPAGAFQNPHSIIKCDPKENLEIVYIGRIDRRRGVGQIIPLSESLIEHGIAHNILVVGDGDMREEMVRYSNNCEFFDFLDNVSRDEIPGILATMHIGIMPMPDKLVWRISSPLKLAEYISSGLTLIGPSHAGNQLNGGEAWNLLSDEENWVEGAIKNIQLAMEGNWDALVSSSIESSKNLRWEGISESLIEHLEQICAN